MLAIAAFSSLLMGGIYGVGLTFSPLLILNLLLTVGLTFVIAITVSNLAIANVVPTPSIIMATGFLGGCLAIYAAWGTSALLRMTEPNIQAFNPRFLMDYARFLYSNGSIEIVDDRGNHEIKGLLLASVWIAEAAGVAIGAAVMAPMLFHQKAPPLCRECMVWQREKHAMLRCGMPEDIESFAGRLINGDIDCVVELPLGTADDDPHIRIDGSWCSSCNENCAASVYVISYSSEPSEVCLCRTVGVSHETFLAINAKATASLERPDS